MYGETTLEVSETRSFMHDNSRVFWAPVYSETKSYKIKSSNIYSCVLLLSKRCDIYELYCISIQLGFKSNIST